MATIGDLLTGLMATAVIGTSAYTLAPTATAVAQDQADQVVGGARVSQVAIALGNQVRKLDAVGVKVDTLTCATPRCNSFTELDGYTINGSYAAVTLIRSADESYRVGVTSKGGTTTAVYDSETSRVTTLANDRSYAAADAPDTQKAKADYADFFRWIASLV